MCKCQHSFYNGPLKKIKEYTKQLSPVLELAAYISYEDIDSQLQPSSNSLPIPLYTYFSTLFWDTGLRLYKPNVSFASSSLLGSPNSGC